MEKKYNNEEEKKQGKIINRQKWGDKNKEKIAEYNRNYYKMKKKQPKKKEKKTRIVAKECIKSTRLTVIDHNKHKKIIKLMNEQIEGY